MTIVLIVFGISVAILMLPLAIAGLAWLIDRILNP
jgi:hypothetical protein